MAELKERYATALLELSMEGGTLKEDLEQAVWLREALQDEQLESFLTHPHISDAAKQGLLQTVFAEKISSHLMSFLYLAVDKSREQLILPALSTYIDMGNQSRGSVVADVVSATKLSDEQLSALQALLCRKLNKHVGLSTKIDPAVLGGLSIHVDGRLIDRTVRTRLNNIKESLTRRSTE